MYPRKKIIIALFLVKRLIAEGIYSVYKVDVES